MRSKARENVTLFSPSLFFHLSLFFDAKLHSRSLPLLCSQYHFLTFLLLLSRNVFLFLQFLPLGIPSSSVLLDSLFFSSPQFFFYFPCSLLNTTTIQMRKKIQKDKNRAVSLDPIYHFTISVSLPIFVSPLA